MDLIRHINSIWKWPGPSRVRHFLWLAVHDRLLTNAERARRHIADSSGCQRCRGDSETLDHVLRQCPFAKEVWAEVLPEALRPDDSRDIKTWLTESLKCPPSQVRFGFTCWFLWRARNGFIFSDIVEAPNKLSQRILAWEVVAQQSKQADQNLSLGRSGSRRDVAVGWRPAPTGWITVNSDGSLLRPSGSTAVGGALRDWQGRLLGAYTMNLGKCTITRAEIWGALKGLELAWEAGHRQVELQLDSRTTMSLLKDSGQHNHQHANLTLSFQALLRRDWIVRITHIYRESNFLADCLAHKGHSLTPGFHFVPVSDPDICHWTLFDSVGGFTV
ncbi:unnamed protein product [Linum trigynum]|uniref:RNase H type-1 domain-containing protein n=1 Tax=Linum trigynum TaxID=586398 RepID=A0AAV2D492_9ROSI